MSNFKVIGKNKLHKLRFELGMKSRCARKDEKKIETRKEARSIRKTFWILQINEHVYLLYIQHLIKHCSDVKDKGCRCYSDNV